MSRATADFTSVIELAQRKGLAVADLDAQAVATFLQAVTLGLVLNDINTVSPMDPDAWYLFTDRVWEMLLPPDEA